MGAAWGEHASDMRTDRIRHVARDRDEPLARGGIVVELAGEQRAGIGMARRSQHLGHRPGLHHGAAIHDAQVVAELGDETELVRDEDDRPGETAAQVFQQRHDLGFHRRIQRGGGLVGEQQVRLDRSAIAISTRWRMPPESWCG